MADTINALDLEPTKNGLGIELAIVLYGTDRGKPRLMLYHDCTEAYRVLSRDDMRAMRDWLTEVLAA